MASEKRIAWLRDRITQMGHPPHMYEQWHAEIEAHEAGAPARSSQKSRRKKRRRAEAFAAAGFKDGELPDGLEYAHGMIVTNRECRAIGDYMTDLGDARPGQDTENYHQLAAKYLAELRKQEGSADD